MKRVLDFRRRRTGMDTPGERSLRRAVAIPAQLHEPGSCPLPVRIVDMLPGECRIWAGYRVMSARPARLIVPDLPPIRATVVWARDWYAALSFAEPLHPAVVRWLVDAYQPVVPAAPRVASSTAPSTP